MHSSCFTRMVRPAFAGIWICSLLLPCQPSPALTQNIFATVNGTSQQIGALDSGLRNSAGNQVEEGLFQLDNAHKYLMNNDHGCQFRYFQIVYHDPDPIKYLGNPLSAPYTDPPKDGWDYQRTPVNNYTTGSPGADQSPFYENDDTNATTYKYPKYSGQLTTFGGQGPFPVHSDAGGYVLTQDVPGYGTAAMTNTTLDFYTFITFVDNDLRANKQFIILAGYQWGIGRDGTGSYYAIQPTALDLSDELILQPRVADALFADGFSDWTALYQGDVNCVPEPATLLLIAIGGVALNRRRRFAA